MQCLVDTVSLSVVLCRIFMPNICLSARQIGRDVWLNPNQAREEIGFVQRMMSKKKYFMHTGALSQEEQCLAGINPAVKSIAYRVTAGDALVGTTTCRTML